MAVTFFTKKTPTLEPRGEFRHLFLLRILSLMIIGIYAGALFGMGFFVYQNVYTAIQNAEMIILLKQDVVAAEAIDFDRLKHVGDAWKEKTEAPFLPITRDPFSLVTSTPKE